MAMSCFTGRLWATASLVVLFPLLTLCAGEGRENTEEFTKKMISLLSDESPYITHDHTEKSAPICLSTRGDSPVGGREETPYGMSIPDREYGRSVHDGGEAIGDSGDDGGVVETKWDPKLYLSLKSIVLPMPEDIPTRYLQMKSLENPAIDTLEVFVNKSRQSMDIFLNGKHLYRWRVSTARRGYYTPVGRYRPDTLERMHYSRKYHNSPMPYSVFFKGGYAIHGTYSIRHLGRPASHGCIRLHPKNAKKLYYMIKKYGKRATKISIKG